MANASAPIQVSEEQVLYFRARRGHLAGIGAADAAMAARAIIGAQSQQLPPGLLALSQRTRGRPDEAELTRQLMEPPRRLVRTWGQRDTLHLYDPTDDWAVVVAAREQWAPGGRGGPMPSEAALARALSVVRSSSQPVTRTDLLSIAPASYVRAISERAAAAGMDGRRLAAARLIWQLALRGDVCVAAKVGPEQSYAKRSDWFPRLSWTPGRDSAVEAASRLACRYLAVYGPATAAEVAHFFGARVTSVREWLALLGGSLTPVCCGDRKGLVALTADLPDLSARPPATIGKWPLRLLPLWDSMLMGHADKSWSVPDDAERKVIWRKAAFVAAVALDRGRVVATWSFTKRRSRLAVEVKPLSRWRMSKHAAQLRREADVVAAHFRLDGADVTFTT